MCVIKMFKNICWANWLLTIMIAILAAISLSSVLSGCGNKGDLTLPKDLTMHYFVVTLKYS